jgi:arginine exporter protein ArgO
MVYVTPIVPAGLAAVFLLIILVESFDAISQGFWHIVLLTLGGAAFVIVYGWLHVSMRRHYAEGE